MIGYIYKITNKVNGKVYIGQTIQSVKDRWYRHCGLAISEIEKKMAIKQAILKYGKDNFTVETLEICDSKDLDDREIYYINYFDSYNKGYNSTKGGQHGGFRPYKTDEATNKEIISLYEYGFSLRTVAKEFSLDKATVKGILVRSNVPLRSTRTYKLSQNDRMAIMNLVNNGTKRKEIMKAYHISKDYLCQLVAGSRRI